jgi:thiol-disulfide isomerase/thioredoxin
MNRTLEEAGTSSVPNAAFTITCEEVRAHVTKGKLMQKYLLGLSLALATSFSAPSLISPLSAQEVAPSVTTTEAATEAPSHPFLRENAAAFITSDGKQADASRVLDKKYVLVYFSASWCPHCKVFTPQLFRFYAENGGGEKFEVVFGSRDKSEAAMLAYMKKSGMPGVGVKYQSPEFKAFMDKISGGKGIPNVVLLNEKDEIVYSTYQNGKYVKPDAKALAKMDAIINPKE